MREIFTLLFGPEGREVYSTTIDGIEWFPAVQLCNLLDLADVSSVMRYKQYAWFRLLDGDKRKFKDSNYHKHGEVWFVSEKGFWKLLARSNTVEAGLFRAWLFSRVLPPLLHRLVEEEPAERGYHQLM